MPASAHASGLVSLAGILSLAALAPVYALAQSEDRTEGQAGYVEANLVTVFYHELGHALIDTLSLPVLGREEDAADTLSVLLIDEIWEPDSAANLARMQALAWLASAEDGGDDLPFWDVHGHDMQRFYNHVCLWYGADPEARQDFAEAFELPEGRADGCAEEYALAHGSWFAQLEEAQEQAPGNALRFLGEPEVFAAAIIAREVEDLNAVFAFPHPIAVTIEACGEVNAYYVPEGTRIIICTEYADDLWGQAQNMDL